MRKQGGGRIIQISSYGGQVAYPGNSMYHATKWGIEGFCESLSKEVDAFNIGVTIVEPGGARTIDTLEKRLADFKTQTELAASTDFPAGE